MNRKLSRRFLWSSLTVCGLFITICTETAFCKYAFVDMNVYGCSIMKSSRATLYGTYLLQVIRSLIVSLGEDSPKVENSPSESVPTTSQEVIILHPYLLTHDLPPKICLFFDAENKNLVIIHAANGLVPSKHTLPLLPPGICHFSIRKVQIRPPPPPSRLR